MIEQSSKIYALALMSMLIATSLITTQHAYSATATGVMIPLYTYPGNTWTTVASAKAAHPSVPIVAIINPSDGPGGSRDSNYVSGIQQLQSAGVVVIGYVATGYGGRSTNTVQSDINSYKSFYPQLQGIFFDEMSNTSGDETYYRNLSNYAKSVGFTFTVGNPGTETLQSYIGTMDNIIIYETGGLPSLNLLGGWHTNYDKSNFSYLAYGVGSLNTSFVTSSSNYVSYMYITNDNLPNPWDSVTPYFANEVATLDTGVIIPPPPPPPTIVDLTVNSVDLAGSTITGLWTEISSAGTLVNSGYTTLTYTATSGTSYQVCMANWQNFVFDHWSNGSTNSCTTVTPTQTTTLTAYYSTGTPVATTATIKVQSLDLSGAKITGLWTEISSGTKIVKKGYTTLTYAGNVGSQYKVCMANWQNFVFDHWGDGSTNSCKTITLSNDRTLTAYYKS